MPKLITTITAIFLLCSIAPPGLKADPQLGNALSSMNKVLANRQQYLDQRKQVDDSLRMSIDSIDNKTEKFLAAENLAFRYTAINVDSALHYYNMAATIAEEQNDESLRRRCEANKVSMLTFMGELPRASQLFDAIDTKNMNKSDLRELYAAGSRLHLAYASYAPEEKAAQYLRKGHEYATRYLELSPQDTPEYNYVSAVIAVMDGRHALALALASDALENTPPESIYYSWCEELLGSIYMKEGKTSEAIIHLANAVKNDTRQGFQIGNAARMLSDILMQEGNFQLADKLLQLALDNAMEAGDRMRFAEAAIQSPDIVHKYRGTSNRSRIIIGVLTALLILCLGALGWLLRLLYKEKERSKAIRHQLTEAGIERATYIKEFLNMCAIYIERMDEYKTTVQKKIKAGRMEDVISMLKSGELFNSQSETFYFIFDRAFIQAYPDFLKQVNKLLQPDKQLEQPEPEILTTDLRLLAFMRLGFDDSTQISRFMGLSLNTIYTYRNRLRSRAINRDTFEKDVTKIGV
ncbi:MAG: hypothetical protein K2M11_02625 [Paramuribaculum sp.]|nr:hypothetical protein [Paramuribaculum sp.]